MYFIGELLFVFFFLGGAALALYGIYQLVRKMRGKEAAGEDGAFKNTFAAITDSLLFRALVVGGITLLLLIPLELVDDIVDERADFQREAVRNIARKWGAPQTVSGPLLVVPYEVWRESTENVAADNGKVTRVTTRYRRTEHKVFLPKKVHFAAYLNPQTLHQGIYEYVVYSSPLAISGEFTLMPEAEFDETVAKVHWEKAYISIGISDIKALSAKRDLVWNGNRTDAFAPGSEAASILGPGFHVGAAVDPSRKSHTFLLTLALQGSGGIEFTPVGETTDITLTGKWASPSFSGSLSPETRIVASTGFTATWSIPNLSRTYPQVGELNSTAFGKASSEAYNETGSLTSFACGADLYETVSLYRMTTRAVKYGALFIGLTFLALMCFELSTGARLHFMQYGLVGVSMSLFYLVLLSVAEHSSFITAFTAASLISVLMNGLYIMTALKSLMRGLTIMGLLAGLYAVLYALLNMEDYALLMGTTLVLIVLGVLMFLTRNLPVKARA